MRFIETNGLDIPIMVQFAKNGIIALLDEQPVHNLAESTALNTKLGDLLSTEELQELRSMELGYGSSLGDQELRRMIAASRDISSDRVLVTGGAISALFLSILVLCGAENEIVTVTPSFPPILDVIDALGIPCKKVRLSFEEGYRCIPERIIRELNSKTRIVLLITPHNPSGVCIGTMEVQAILCAMKKKCPDAFLIVDETYREATYGDRPVPATAAQLSDQVITIASLSKCHGAPGLRIGWLTCKNLSTLEQLTTAKLNTLISCSVLDEFVARKTLERSHALLAERRKMISEALAIVSEWIDRQNERLQWVRPQGGALCCVRLNPSVFDDLQVQKLYEQARVNGVQLAPGSWFYEDDHVFRLGFGFLPLAQLGKALDVIEHVVSRLSS